MLAELSILPEYRSDDSLALIEDFYTPCLEKSVLYRRAVGYFTSHGIALAARGVNALIKNGGSMRLVASPHLSEQDRQAIESGYKSRDKAIADSIVGELEHVENDLDITRLSYLSKLIAEGNLEIQLAIPIDSRGNIKRGLYHDLNSTRKCNSKDIAKGISCHSLSSRPQNHMRSTNAKLQAAYPGAKIRNKSDEPSRT